MRHTILCLLFVLSCFAVQAETHDEHIFVFERSINPNYVCYDINLQNGSLCQKEPLKSYWVLPEVPKIDALTFLDKKMAFGIKVVRSEKNEATVRLSAYKDLNIRICKHKGKWVGIVKWNGHEIVLQKMFAQMKPPFSIKCEYVDIYGTDLKTGKKCRERITP